MSDLVTYLINLDDSTDRLEFAKQQLGRIELEFERFPAVDTRGKDPLSFPEYDDKSARLWYGRPLRGGEIGCYFSHLRVLEKFLETENSFALIVEDDCVFSHDFREIFDEVLRYLRDNPELNWDALNFGEPAKEKVLTPLHTWFVDYWPQSICAAHLFPLNTHCILWSRRGAEAFLANYGRMWKPVDHAMRHVLVRRGSGLCMARMMAIQSDAESVIDNTSQGGRQTGESRWYWFNVWRIKRAEKPIARRFRNALRARLKASRG